MKKPLGVLLSLFLLLCFNSCGKQPVNFKLSDSKLSDSRPGHKIINVQNFNDCRVAGFVDYYGGDGKLDLVLCEKETGEEIAITRSFRAGTNWEDWEAKFREISRQSTQKTGEK